MAKATSNTGFDFVKELQEKKDQAKITAEQKKQEEKTNQNIIENVIEKTIEDRIQSKSDEVVKSAGALTFNLTIEKKKKEEKVVKSYYFKVSTVKKIKKYAKEFRMKDSEFIEYLLEQFFEGQEKVKGGK